jgi:hypothetical protein
MLTMSSWSYNSYLSFLEYKTIYNDRKINLIITQNVYSLQIIQIISRPSSNGIVQRERNVDIANEQCNVIWYSYWAIIGTFEIWHWIFYSKVEWIECLHSISILSGLILQTNWIEIHRLHKKQLENAILFILWINSESSQFNLIFSRWFDFSSIINMQSKEFNIRNLFRS